MSRLSLGFGPLVVVLFLAACAEPHSQADPARAAADISKILNRLKLDDMRPAIVGGLTGVSRPGVPAVEVQCCTGCSTQPDGTTECTTCTPPGGPLSCGGEVIIISGVP